VDRRRVGTRRRTRPGVRPTERRRLVAATATVLGGATALGTVVTESELEVTFLMVTAVIAGLACFDAAMDRRRSGALPWIALSLAPVAKTVPAVLYELRADSGASFARHDHLGTVLFGVCLLVAVWSVGIASRRLGGDVAVVDSAVVGVVALAACVAGTSVAFLYERDFGSIAVARAIESSTWLLIGGLLAAAAIAAARNRTLSPTLAALVLLTAAVAAVLTMTVIGAEVGPGWWAILAALLAAIALWTDRGLDERPVRDRPSSAPAAIAVVTGIIAAASAIAARSDRDAWPPGWALLGGLSLVLFLLALRSRPADDQLESLQPDVGHGARSELPPAPATGGHGADAVRDRLEIDTARAIAARRRVDADQASTTASVPEPAGVDAPARDVAAEGRAEQNRARREGAEAPGDSGARSAESEPSTPDEPGQPDAIGSAPAFDTAPTAPLSDATFVASAEAAARIRSAPAGRRHSLAPVEQAHHFDPSTGLLSAAGLQHALVQAFGVPRSAGHVTMLLFAIRDMDDIEREHGRLAAAAVTRTVADRIRSLLPDGSGARFRRTAYAVVLVGDRSDDRAAIREMADVLMRLRAPVDTGTSLLRIDVVAGMAQCYERERAAPFVERANLGLARAVQSPEPTLVAMP